MLSNPDTLPMLLAAFGGGWVGKKLKLPGGALLLSTIAVAVVGNVWNLSHKPPMEMVLILQIFMGCMLGQSINRRFWQDFLQIWRPTLMVIFVFTLAAIPFAVLLVGLCGFEIVTAVLAATPARMQDMIILATSLDSDAVTVMLMQLARQFSIIAVTPFILSRYLKQEKAKAAASSASATSGGNAETAGTSRKHGRSMAEICKAGGSDVLILFTPGLLGGAIGHTTGHILGALLGAFAGVAASRVIWLKAGEVPFPKSFAFIIQCLAGILLGSRITPETGDLMLARLLPLTAAVVYIVASGLFIASVLHRRHNWHGALSWMAAAPGRASDMLAISQDISLSGKERLALVSVHAVRQVYFTLFVSAVMTFV